MSDNDVSASKPPETSMDSVLVALKRETQSLLLATLGEDNEPHTGYTPYVFDDQAESDHHMLIFVSQLSLHTRDLLANERVSVMLIADEAVSPQIFARTRVSYQCRAERIMTTHPRYEALLDHFQKEQGKMIGLLRTLPDFVLFRLVPERGQFVMGFGQAYKLQGTKLDQFEHAKTA